MEDRYGKFIWSVIAAALTVIALNPWIAPRPAEAQSVGQTVNARIIFVNPQVMQDLKQAGGVPVVLGQNGR